MTTATAPAAPAIALETVEDFVNHIKDLVGDIPPERIRMSPLPGTATERDVLEAKATTGRLCELVDGILVEKPMGWYESHLAALLIFFLQTYLEQNDLGFLTGEAGMIRTTPGPIRMPDVAFFAWRCFPSRLVSRAQILATTPDLAVEVLSPSNTEAEMTRKRDEYFAGGCRIVWEVYPGERRIQVYTAVDSFEDVSEDGTLTGEPVLPGFTLSVRHWFERAAKRGEE
jgi:Uma2 family endonuclease